MAIVEDQILAVVHPAVNFRYNVDHYKPHIQPGEEIPIFLDMQTHISTKIKLGKVNISLQQLNSYFHLQFHFFKLCGEYRLLYFNCTFVVNCELLHFKFR